MFLLKTQHILLLSKFFKMILVWMSFLVRYRIKFTVFVVSHYDLVHTGLDPYGHHINLKSLKTSMTLKFVTILQNWNKAYHRKELSRGICLLSKLSQTIVRVFQLLGSSEGFGMLESWFATITVKSIILLCCLSTYLRYKGYIISIL